MSSKRRKNNSFQLPKKQSKDISIGSVVWAKWRANVWWPAIKVRSTDCYQKDPKKDHMWVFWFGDHRVSMVLEQNVTEFTSSFDGLIGNVVNKTHLCAVQEALQVLAERSNYDYHNLEDLTDWAKSCFCGANMESDVLPDTVLKHLKELKKAKIEKICLSSQKEFLNISCPVVDEIKSGTLDIESVCIGCRKINVSTQHPLFKGGLCTSCKDALMETIFAVGDDGKNLYCILCGNLGRLIMCDNSDCQYSYCFSCISVFIDHEDQRKILETSPWICFFCSDSKDNAHIFEKRNNWEENLSSFFQLSDVLKVSFQGEKFKKPIRVLSLFDGISAGFVALSKLEIEIEVYYASEIEENALNVSRLRHSNSITHIGDVTYLLEAKILEMCPIDLLIGGSPCNDLALVNPLRKGLYDVNGTGCLFFNFFHVLKTLQRFNKDRPLFFLFENVAAMSQKDRKIISSFLMHDPALIDAKYFSAQSRPRFFWGNIPGLHAQSRIFYEEDNVLDDYLLKELGRNAKVRKINTVTTSRNSLKGSIMPVEMNGTPDVLWITELEKVFGFPVHYTDAGNLSVSKRQELLGKSWSVPVIVKLLSPLQNFFKKRKNLTKKDKD